MVLGVFKGRATAIGKGDLAEKEFAETGRAFLIWNHRTERIEDFFLGVGGPEEGRQNYSVWTVDGEGVYNIGRQTSSAATSEPPPESVTLVVTKDTGTIVMTGRVNAEGDRLPTQVMSMKRVK